MTSIDEILANIGLQPGIQSEPTGSQELSTDSSIAEVSSILAYTFGASTLTLTGVMSWLVWRFRHSIRAFMHFRNLGLRINFVNAVNFEVNANDLENGNVDQQRVRLPLQQQVGINNIPIPDVFPEALAQPQILADLPLD